MSRWMPRITSPGGGGGPPPPEGLDRFAPKYLVGNVAAGDSNVAYSTDGFEYIPDPGDGSGIALAFAAAAVAPGDVWIRPGVYDLRIGATATLTQPASCLCRGAGIGATFIIGRATGNQTILTMGAGAQLRDMQVLSPAPTGAGAGSGGVIQAGAGCTISDCLIGLTRSLTVDRTQIIGINFPVVNGRELVVDTRCLIDSLNAQPTPAASQAIVFGDGVAVFPTLATDSEVRDVVVNEITPGVGSCQRAVVFLNVSGGRAFNVEHANCRTPVFGSFLWSWTGSSPGSIVRAPKYSGCRVDVLDDQAGGALAGFSVALSGAVDILAVTNLLMEGCRVAFQSTQTPVAATELIGYFIVNGAQAAETAMVFGQITDCIALFSVIGFLIDASGEDTLGRINSIKVTGCIESTSQSGHTQPARGMRIRGQNGQDGPNVRDIGVHNCDFRTENAAAVGIEIDDDGVSNTIVVGNSLRNGAGGDGFVDRGTGTQVGLNVL